jgi:hypothetical protein
VSDDDLWKAFEESDPTRGVSDDDLDELLSTAQLLDRVHDETRRRRVRHFPLRWRRVGIVTTSVVIVLSGTAAALSLISSPTTNTTELACFSAAALHSKTSAVTLDAHPLRTCAALMKWPAPAPKGLPSGVLCVLSNGSLGGFPTTGKANECATIGLEPYDGHVLDVPAAAFQEAAENYFAAHRCATLATARTEVSQLLTRHHVTGWRVRVSGSTSAGACATLAVRAGRKIVAIVGVKF